MKAFAMAESEVGVEERMAKSHEALGKFRGCERGDLRHASSSTSSLSVGHCFNYYDLVCPLFDWIYCQMCGHGCLVLCAGLSGYLHRQFRRDNGILVDGVMCKRDTPFIPSAFHCVYSQHRQSVPAHRP